MSSSSSDENETTIHRNSTGSGIYSQPRAGSSKRNTVRHEVSDEEQEEEHYARFREETVVEVDDGITVLLSSLHFEQKRNVVPTDDDDNKLRELHEKIFALITNETDSHRRRRLKKALPSSNHIREQVYYLRRKPSTPLPAYYERLIKTLHIIVKESFGEEYRKVATVLGLVEALAEVLILEVQVFGIPEQNSGDHRNIRKLIANALTNLTYGQIHSKRRLCSYDGFIRCVVRIIIESPNITQVYAGLIRNLSWNADSGMSEALQPTVHALAIAAVHAHNHRLDVTATLSALWNLAGHSVENKRTICDTPNCLKVLASLLSPDARLTSLVDSATGILKYVSQYLANTSTHLELRSLLITRMLTLLKSASFTCVTNTLGAIANLIVKDPHMQQLIRQDPAAVQQLNVLRNSNRDDIRNAVKSVLNTLNQPCSHRYSGGEMSHSVATESSFHQGTASPRLLSLRATRASPGKYVQQQQLQVAPMDQRSSSLPRHFAMQRNTFVAGGMMAQSYNPQMDQQQQQMIYQMQQQMFQSSVAEEMHHQQIMYLQQQQQQFHQIQQKQAPPPQPPVDDDLEIPTSTVMGTRSNSERSLGSMNPGSVMPTEGWNSTLGTEANSSRALSPVSFSDIPASPTMCAQVFNLGKAEEPKMENTTHYSSGSANTMTRSDGATTVPIDNLVTPTYATLNGPENSGNPTLDTNIQNPGYPTTTFSTHEQNTLNLDNLQISTPTAHQLVQNPIYHTLNPQTNDIDDPESPDDVLPLPGPSFSPRQSDDRKFHDDEEDDYAIIDGAALKSDDDLLARSIQSEMPTTSSSTPKMKVSPRLNGFFSPIPKTSPRTPRHQDSEADRLLMESIMSEMPRSSKNEEADRREPSDQHGFIRRGSEGMHRMESLESQPSSEDSDLQDRSNGPHTMRLEEIDTSLPMDCIDDDDYDYTEEHFEEDFEDEEDPDATQFDEGIDPHLTIDCSMISSGSGITSMANDSGALATSTPKGSTSSIPGVRRATRVSTNGKTRLPIPKTNGSLVDKSRMPIIAASRPRLPPKPSLLKDKHYPEEDNSIENQKDETIYVNAPIVEAEQERIYMNAIRQKNEGINTTPPTKSAIVTPYNYQKPPFNNRSSSDIQNEKNVTPNPNQMLVTIV